MKIKLLKKLRSRSFIERRNSEYKAVLESSMFTSGLSSNWLKTEVEAKQALRCYILLIANTFYKRKKSKAYYALR